MSSKPAPVRIGDKRLYQVSFAWPTGSGHWVDETRYVMAKSARKARRFVEDSNGDDASFYEVFLVKAIALCD